MLQFLETSKFPPVIAAANNILATIHNGRMFSDKDEDKAASSLAADRLEETVAAATRELADAAHAASPFLRYRREVLARTELQDFVLFLFGGGRFSFYHFFTALTPHETLVSLRCVTHYSVHGENDPHFMALAAEIHDMRQAAKEAA